jgi:Mg/Co/Ni transporter MgtE
MDQSSALELYIKKFSDYDPVLSAHIIETMDIEESLRVFDDLPADVSKTIFENLQNENAAKLLGSRRHTERNGAAQDIPYRRRLPDGA